VSAYALQRVPLPSGPLRHPGVELVPQCWHFFHWPSPFESWSLDQLGATYLCACACTCWRRTRTVTLYSL
jgi:hypothetical protein